MKETTRNFVIGIVALIGMVGFCVLLLLFGNFDTSIRPTYRVVVQANDALGLRLGSQVTLAGVPVGEVEAVEVLIESDHPVRITINVNGAIDLPDGVTAAVAMSLIGGTARMNFSIPDEYQAGGATLPRDGNAVVTASFEGLDTRFARMLDEKFAVIESKLSGFSETLQSIDALAKEAQKWLGDEQLFADSKSAVWKAQEFIDQATTTTLALTDVARTLQGSAETLTTSIQPVLDQLSKTFAQVELLTKQAKDGKGTIGLMMTNPDLYNSLIDSAQRLKRTLGEVELLLQKIRAEGLGVKF